MMRHHKRVFTTEAQRTQRGCGERQSFRTASQKFAFLRMPSVFSVSSAAKQFFDGFGPTDTRQPSAGRCIEREEQPSHVSAWTRTPLVSSESAARASAETAEQQPVVPICGACQPVVRGLVSRHREVDLYASAHRCMPTAPGTQPPVS